MLSSFNMTKLNDLLKDFYQLTHIRITVFDDTFQELTAYPQELPPFCRMIRNCETGAEKCRNCDRHACEAAAKCSASYTYRCHAGMTECIAPIRLGNIIIGYLFFGHVFSYDNYQAGWEIVRSLCSDYPLSMDALEDACRKQPIISTEYIASASHIMNAVASFLCMERMVSLKQQTLPVQIDDYIQKHFTEKITSPDIARHFHIGKTKLYEIAQQSYGMGIAEYIRKLRIEKAIRLLTEEEDFSLAEIAYECGFDDYNYFITVFKKVTGTSPHAYRQQSTLLRTE